MEPNHPLVRAWFDATADNDKGAMETLLARGVSIDVRSFGGYTALFTAALRGNISLMDWLVSLGADPKVGHPLGLTLAHLANQGDGGVAMWALDHGVDPSAHDGSGETPLIVASHNDKPDLVKRLLAMGVDVNDVDKNNKTALSHAAFALSDEVVSLLLAHGADLEIVGLEGDGTLHEALARPATAAILLEHGANPDALDRQGRTPLMHALERFGEGPAVDLMLEAAKDINYANEEGISAVMIVARQDSAELLARLAQKGADLNAVDKNQRSVLEAAITGGNRQTAEALVAHGVDIHRLGHRGRTLVMHAVWDGQEELALWAIDQGVNHSRADDIGKTPLLVAAEADYPRLVARLLALGEDPELSNRDGISPKDVAKGASLDLIRVHVDHAALQGETSKATSATPRNSRM